MTLPRLALVDERRERRVVCARRARERMFGATAQKVTPMIVSARVVNTYSMPRAARLRQLAYGKANRTPSLLPIQFACISFTRSGQPGSVVERSRAARRRSA